MEAQDFHFHQIGAVIITPTRELAIQIDQVLDTLLKDIFIRYVLICLNLICGVCIDLS